MPIPIVNPPPGNVLGFRWYISTVGSWPLDYYKLVRSSTLYTTANIEANFDLCTEVLRTKEAGASWTEYDTNLYYYYVAAYDISGTRGPVLILWSQQSTGNATVAQGGTGGTTAATARAALSAAASGVNSDVTSLTALQDINGGPLHGVGNFVTNGDFRVAQRGTTVNRSGVAGYTLDGWKVPGAAGSSVSQVADHPLFTGGVCAEFTNTGGSDWAMHFIPSEIAKFLVGKGMNLAAWFKNISGVAASYMSLDYANAVDNFSACTSIASVAFTANGTWAQKSVNATIPANGANGLRIFITTSGGGAAVNRVADVQLAFGSSPSQFMRRLYATELGLCQRTLYALNPGAVSKFLMSPAAAASATVAIATAQPPVKMRAVPTLSVAGAANAYSLFFSGVNTQCSVAPVLHGSTTADLLAVQFQVAGGLTAGQAGMAMTDATNGAGAALYFSAEL